MQEIFAKNGNPNVAREGRSAHSFARAIQDYAAQRAFWTDSFWMGVDVPGDALSNVMITRLPFAVLIIR